MEKLTDTQTIAYHDQQAYEGLSWDEKAMANTRDHAEALVVNRIWDARNANTKAERLSAESGFTVAQCDAELVAEEGDYFAALYRLRNIVSDAHAEALELNDEIDDGKTMDMYHKWNTAPTTQIRRDMLAVAHEEALQMNASYA